MVSLISIIGPPGVGKSTIAHILSKEKGIYFFDRDILLNNVFGHDRDSPFYRSLKYNLKKFYWQLATQNAINGISNIIESPMTKATQGKKDEFIDNTIKEAEIDGFLFKLIYCTAPEEIILSNLKSRNLDRDIPKYEHWDQFVTNVINVPGPSYEHLKIDTSKPLEESINKIFKYI
ncbi:ATP-binding protein [Candidatus Woesearchaeota archaeon]|nr:ATP-binding protein [Candidatus Woesearchaeota archaeon]